LHLQANKFTLQGYISDVVAIGYIYHYGITGREGNAVYISVIFFPATFELDLHDIEFIDRWDPHMGKPIKGIHFIAIACSTGAVVLAASA
jgi:hypothetical protein